MFAAPLYMSTDLRNITKENQEILLNKEIIDVDQDPLGKGGVMVYRDAIYELWSKELVNNQYACAIYNKSPKEITVKINPESFGLKEKIYAHFHEMNYKQINFDLDPGDTMDIEYSK